MSRVGAPKTGASEDASLRQPLLAAAVDPESGVKPGAAVPRVGPQSGSSAPNGAGRPPPPPPSKGAKPDPDALPSTSRSWVSLFWDACVSVWPENHWLQLRAVTSFILLLSMRVLNIAVPVLYKNMIDGLMAIQANAAGEPSTSGPVWVMWGWVSPWVLLYLALLFFQGGAGGGMMGAINNLRQVLWIPVGQDAYRRISLRIFTHVLRLDLSFHLTRKTGEVTKQIDRGTNAIQNLLSTLVFSVAPTLVDVLVACVYLTHALDWQLAVTVFVAVGSYIPVTIWITEWRSSLRREMNTTSQAQAARITDALLNWETVQYFTNQDYEVQQYAHAIDAYQHAEYKAMASINLLNAVQSLIMWSGSTTGLLLLARNVYRGNATVGDVVLFLSLITQLYAPLNWFGSYYRTIQQYFIDMENLFDLLGKESKVQDKPKAKDLVLSNAAVQYDSVCFHYDPAAPVLRHVSWAVPGGQTVAFVGATGSGKSTLTRLLFRFYDVTGGAIRVDGQDIRDVSQLSLRRAVGMVPQDTVLFNDSIMTNIRYGNLDANDEQVYDAADAACIHEAIITRFPKGYETVVGERGLRLSGGEKQRVAFARALLKNPGILVLDEATSALDTLTERKIQAALSASRSTRTTLIVAHRLSTIVDADLIVVMHLGQVVELGSHSELLARQGLYAELWSKQATGAGGSGSAGGPGSDTGSETLTLPLPPAPPAPLPTSAALAQAAMEVGAGTAMGLALGSRGITPAPSPPPGEPTGGTLATTVASRTASVGTEGSEVPGEAGEAGSGGAGEGEGSAAGGGTAPSVTSRLGGGAGGSPAKQAGAGAAKGGKRGGKRK